ncbi:hypothetical protein [Streptomyces sp. NPDC058694]|uniref:hypothetical protein n=1 Tax=Streptomyces sp. NPDC058694 TaxID=3346603 RepID=UPI003656532F
MLQIGGVGLTVSAAAAGHQIDDDPKTVAAGRLEGVNLVHCRDGDFPRDVLGRDYSVEWILGDSAAAACVEKDIFEGVEGVLLCGEPDGTFLHRHDKVVDDRRCERAHPTGFQDGENLAAENLVD